MLLLLLLLQAVVKFNLQRVLGDPTGEQDRPLVVRRANMRKPAASLMPGGAAGLQAAAAGLSPNSAFSSGSSAGGGYMSISGSHLTVMELQQQGSIGQMGLPGGPDMPYYLQPLAAMQVCRHSKEGWLKLTWEGHVRTQSRVALRACHAQVCAVCWQREH